MNSRRFIIPFLFLALISGLSSALAGGILTGTVSGIVYDKATKQPLAGAEVVLTNARTGAPKRTVTDSNGQYTLNQVFPGIYALRVEMKDYPPFEMTDLEISINRTFSPVPPIELEKGASAVTQKSQIGKVNIADAQRSMVMDSLATTTLPVPGVRSFDRLALLAPGVYEVPASSGTGPGVGPGVGTAGQFSVNGQRGRNNNFLVDGSDNNDQDVGVRRQGYVTLVPQNMESVENYQIVSGNYSAEFGRNSGSIANAVSKSGGNDFHGSLYAYYTHNKLQARNYFDQKEAPVTGESPYQRTQYGFALGGPVVKDRTFWFASFEQQRIKDRPEKHFAVPTLDQRAFLIYSPLKDKNGDGTSDLQEFFFKDLGIALFDIGGKGIWNLVPLPNNPIGPYGANTFTRQLNADGRGTILSLKLDHRFSENHNFAGRYNFTDDTSTIPVTGGGINSSIAPEVRTQNLSLYLHSSLGANTDNEARVSYGRTSLDFLETAGSPMLFGTQNSAEIINILRKVGVPIDYPLYKNLSTPTRTDYGSGSYGPFGTTGALGKLNITPFSPVGVDVLNFPQSRANNTYQLADSYTSRFGNHILKAGVDIRRSQQNSRLDRNTRAYAEFNGGYGFIGQSPGIFLRGVDVASIAYATNLPLTMIPDFNNDGAPDYDTTIGLRFSEYNLFLQDDWKVGPRVTFNFGMRYEMNTTPREVNDKIETALINPSTGIPAQSTPPDLVPVYANIDASLRRALNGRQIIYDSDRNNFAPRIGIAVDPFGDGKTAFRAGYGMFFDQNISAVTSQSRNVYPRLIPFNTAGFPFINDGIFMFHPQNLTLNIGSEVYSVLRPGSLNTTGFLAKYFQTFIALSAVQGNTSGVSFTLPVKNLDTPYAQHFHFTAEHEIAKDTLISLAYVGARGINLTRFRTPNNGPGGVPNLDVSDEPSPWDPSKAALITNSLFNRFDPWLGAITVFENTARSKYNALQAMVQRRFTGGLQFTGTYTWAHATDDVSDVFDGLGFYAIAQNDKNLKQEHASANFDVRHRFAGSWVYDLNAGSSHWLAGGWRVAGIFVAQTGQPYTVNSSFDINQDGNLTDRLETVAGILEVNRGPIRYVLPAGAVVDGIGTKMLAQPGRDGLIGRNSFTAAGIVTLDLTLLKAFRIDESRNVEFRTEFFNFLNHTNFGVPVRILETPGFGGATDTSINPRTVQLALKFNF